MCVYMYICICVYLFIYLFTRVHPFRPWSHFVRPQVLPVELGLIQFVCMGRGLGYRVYGSSWSENNLTEKS